MTKTDDVREDNLDPGNPYLPAAGSESPAGVLPYASVPPPKLFTVGTLSYTKQGLWLLFFWLMWNDFTIMLMEQVGNVNGLSMQKRGASFAFLGTLGMVGGIMGMWINPVFSTWSDRLRTRFGRRRPILFLAAPLFAVTLIAIPFMPDLYHYLMGIERAARLLRYIPNIDDPKHGEVLFIAAACVVNGLFNAVLLSIFSYYYWDVVPKLVLGRFQAMSRIVTSAAMVVWNLMIFGLAEFHPKEVYIGVSLFCLAIYLVSVWRVKEGQYPPPEPRVHQGPIEPILVYFKDCFSKPYYLWIFFGALVFQLGNRANEYMMYYLINDLKMSYNEVGWVNGLGQGFSGIFGVLLGYWIGSMTDRLRPLRVLPFLMLARGLVLILGFFVVHDKVSALLIYIMNEGVLIFCISVAIGAATVELFPMEKLGQFCSAQSFFYQTILIVFSPLIGLFYDWIHFNRASYLWGGFFSCLSGLVAFKVYYNWKRQQHQADLQTVPA